MKKVLYIASGLVLLVIVVVAVLFLKPNKPVDLNEMLDNTLPGVTKLEIVNIGNNLGKFSTSDEKKISEFRDITGKVVFTKSKKQSAPPKPNYFAVLQDKAGKEIGVGFAGNTAIIDGVIYEVSENIDSKIAALYQSISGKPLTNPGKTGDNNNSDNKETPTGKPMKFNEVFGDYISSARTLRIMSIQDMSQTYDTKDSKRINAFIKLMESLEFKRRQDQKSSPDPTYFVVLFEDSKKYIGIGFNKTVVVADNIFYDINRSVDAEVLKLFNDLKPKK